MTAPKGVIRVVKVRELPPTAANTIWDLPQSMSGTRSRLITLPARAIYFTSRNP